MALSSSASSAGSRHVQARADLLTITSKELCRFTIARCLALRAESLGSVCRCFGTQFSRQSVELDCSGQPPIATTWLNLSSEEGFTRCSSLQLSGILHAVLSRHGSNFLNMPHWDFLSCSEKVTDYAYLSCRMIRGSDTSQMLIALCRNTGKEVSRTSLLGTMHQVVRIAAGVGVLVSTHVMPGVEIGTSHQHELFFWDIGRRERSWHHTCDNPIRFVECPWDEIAVCITSTSFVGLDVETGMQLYRNDSVLTRFQGGMGGVYAGTDVCRVEHSGDSIFVAYLQHEYDDDDQTAELLVSAIDVGSGNEVWTKAFYNGGQIGPQLAYSDSSGHIMVSTEWCCTPSCGQFFMLDSLTGQMVMEIHFDVAIVRIEVFKSLVVMVTHKQDWSQTGDQEEYEIVVRKIMPLAPGELFRAMTHEHLCEVSVLENRFLYWLSYTGRVVLIDMIVGERLLDMCLGYEGSWSGRIQFFSVPTDCLSLSATVMGWLEITLPMVAKSKNGPATLKLRWEHLQPLLPTEDVELVRSMLFDKLGIVLE